MLHFDAGLLFAAGFSLFICLATAAELGHGLPRFGIGIASALSALKGWAQRATAVRLANRAPDHAAW